jgi:hypothetical protein
MTWFARILAVVAVALVPAAATAGPIFDAANDFLPTFLGPHNGDLDVLSAEVLFNGNSFILRAIVNGQIGTTPGGFYVWGFNRGAGTQGFPTIAPGVLFDRVVVVNSNGTTNVAGGSVSISGNTFTAEIPASALPSTGFLPSQFTWNLWPRSPAIPGNALGNIADFAPDNSNALVTTTPEPASLLVLGIAGGAIALRTRRRSVAA